MKRQVFLKFLSQNNCILLREGSRHSLYKNLDNGNMTAVPRHPNIEEHTVKSICKQLGIQQSPIN